MAEKTDLKSVQCRFESDRGDVAKRKTKVSDVPIVVEGEYKYAIFGWCGAGQHDGCRVEFPGHRCSCECHGRVEESVDDNLVR